jgi:preprotein translocase subunit YajC
MIETISFVAFLLFLLVMFIYLDRKEKKRIKKTEFMSEQYLKDISLRQGKEGEK